MDGRDRETFDRFAERYSAIEDLIPAPPRLRPRVVPSAGLRAGTALVGLAAFLVAVVVLARIAPGSAGPSSAVRATASAVGSEPGATVSAVRSEPAGSSTPGTSDEIAHPAWLPAGWYAIRPHIWTLPVGPQLFASNVPIADPCPVEHLSADACQRPLAGLPENGILVTLNGSAVLMATKNFGIITTTAASSVCASLGGDVAMWAPVNGGLLSACIRGPDIAEFANAFRQIVAVAVDRSPPATIASLPPGISRDEAVRLATPHVTSDSRLIEAEAGPFALLDTHPGETGPGAPVKPTDLVWVVSYTDEMTICPPSAAPGDANPCGTPRLGLLVVYLDYTTGRFLMSEGSSPGP